MHGESVIGNLEDPMSRTTTTWVTPRPWSYPTRGAGGGW